MYQKEHQVVHLCTELTGQEGTALGSGKHVHHIRFENSDIVELTRQILREIEPTPEQQILEVLRRIEEKL